MTWGGMEEGEQFAFLGLRILVGVSGGCVA